MPRQKLTKRKDDYFKCKYRGKQFYGRTQKEAIDKRDEYIAAEKAGLDHKKEGLSFREYGEEWVSVFHASCGKALRKQFLNMVDAAADYMKDPLLKDITSMQLQGLCNSLSCYSTSHVGKFMTVLNGIFRTAASDGVILRNPMDAVQRPKCKRTEGHRSLEQWERDLVLSTYAEHDFGPAAMVMMYAGLRRGEVLFLDVDRDVDFENKTITVNGAVAFPDGTEAVITEGKTANALRTIPLAKPLELALQGRHGLLLTKEDGGMMTQTAFVRKLESYLGFLETKLNGCQKRWYGKTREHKKLLAEGKELAPWREVNIRCHDFRVDFCTRAYEADVPIKVLQSFTSWISGHTTGWNASSGRWLQRKALPKN